MELLEGRPIAKRLNSRIKEMVDSIVENTGERPKLVTVFIGTDSASEWYNKSIKKSCDSVGIEYELHRYSSIEYKWARDLVKKLDKDPAIHGILINQPLPEGFQDIVELVAPEKDIEGVTAQNLGKLILNEETLWPCTPQAVMTIIDDYHIDVTGLKVCMVGLSIIVGRPLGIMLSNRDATVTLCHAKTRDLASELRTADMVIVAIGNPKYIKKEWIKPGAIVIDIGTNYTDNGLVGDVDFEEVKKVASMITPVPGGVGGLTNIILLKNCVEAYMRQKNLAF